MEAVLLVVVLLVVAAIALAIGPIGGQRRSRTVVIDRPVRVRPARVRRVVREEPVVEEVVEERY